MIKDFYCQRLDDEEIKEETCRVVEEIPLSIFINGQAFCYRHDKSPNEKGVRNRPSLC